MKFTFTVESSPRPWRLAILAVGLLCPAALMAKNPPIIVQSPPLQASSATLERLEKLGAFRSGPILFQVGCKAVQGRIVKVFIERSSRYPFLDREGADWVTKHWRFGVAATGTYHIRSLLERGRPGREPASRSRRWRNPRTSFQNCQRQPGTPCCRAAPAPLSPLA